MGTNSNANGRERGRGSHVHTDSAPDSNLQSPVFMRNEERSVQTGNAEEIPLRKIEIISESGQLLDASNPEVIVTAKLYPENTTYRDVQWSVVNDAGIVSNIAKVEVITSGTGDESGSQSIDLDEKRHRVKVSAMGDGAFRLRATSSNGTDKPKLISQLGSRQKVWVQPTKIHMDLYQVVCTTIPKVMWATGMSVA